MLDFNDIRNGIKIEIEGVPYEVVNFQMVKPGKGNAFTRTKMKSLIDGRVLEITFKANEKIKPADVETRKFQYLYPEDTNYVFMDNTSYEQVYVPQKSLGDKTNFLLENTEVEVILYNGAPVGIELPNFVVMEVTSTEPGLKGDTATGASKPATVSTGYTLMVPLYITENEKIKIDTRNGKFVERAK